MTSPRTIFIDVDTQVDFMEPHGSLHVPAADSVRTSIADILAGAEQQGLPILGSVDSHAYDAWEFEENGGPFAPHCIKGSPGWLRVFHDRPAKTRFVPMQTTGGGVTNLVGEANAGSGPRALDAAALAAEAAGGVGVYFEKEVYSLFSNPVASPVVEALVAQLGGRDAVRFDVLGYCTGGYCVDAAAQYLAERGYRVRVLAHATAAIGGPDAARRSCAQLGALGIEWVETP